LAKFLLKKLITSLFPLCSFQCSTLDLCFSLGLPTGTCWAYQFICLIFSVLFCVIGNSEFSSGLWSMSNYIVHAPPCMSLILSSSSELMLCWLLAYCFLFLCVTIFAGISRSSPQLRNLHNLAAITKLLASMPRKEFIPLAARL
jgi:hypothetical protein